MSSERLRPFVPDLAAEWLVSHAEETHRSVDGTMVFADISGFTPLTERLTRLGVVGSEELSDILDTTFAALLGEVRDEGADLLKWGGDAVLLLFRGADHGPRAVRAAVGMRRALYSVGRTRSSAGSVTLRMSVGVHSDRFHAFLVGDPTVHRELIVSGPAASRVAELETAAGTGQILISDQTAALLPPSSVTRAASGELLVRRAPRAHDGLSIEATMLPGEVDVAELLPPPVRAHLLAGAGAPEHRAVAVAFVQFSGTDAVLADQGPDAAAAALDDLVRRTQAACSSHGVTFQESDINRDGGKIMLVCGAPTRAEDVEDRLVRAVHEIVAGAGVLPVRAGINRGRVFASDFGPAFRRTFSVKGDAINVAARVMGKAEPGQVLATRAVLERVRRGIRTQPVPPFRVKGKSRPIDAALVTGARAVGEAGPAAAEVVLGREPEISQLLGVLGEVGTGHGHVVEVRGDAGMGKTALVRELISRSGGRMRVVRGPSRRFGGAASHQAVRRLLRDVIGARQSDSVGAQVKALRECVERAVPDLLPWLPLLATLFGAILPETPQVRDLDVHYRPARAARAVCELLSAVLTEPTLVVLEGADDMDEASAAIIREILEASSQHPWLVLLTRRSADRGPVIDTVDGHLTLELGPLDDDTCMTLLTTWTQEQPLGDHLLRAVAAKAGGNPLHLRSLLELTVSRGTVEGLPDGVEEVLGAEIDGLRPRVRTILRFAAVLGERLDVASLDDLIGLQGWSLLPEDLQDLSAHLVRERPTDTWYRFTSTLLHEAAYAGLPYRLRRRLHLRSGEALEASGADPVPFEALSTHFFEAGQYDKALTYSQQAAERAVHAYSSLEAMSFYERALVCAARASDVAPTLVGRLHEAIGDAAELAGLTTVAIEAYRSARPSLREDALASAAIVAKEVGLHQRVGAFNRSDRIAGYARRRLDGIEGAEADALRARLAVQTAFVHHLRSRHERALDWSKTAVEQALRTGDPTVLALAYNARALVLTAAGITPDQPYGELALASSEEAGDLRLQTKCLTNLAISAIIDGRWPAAEELLGRAAGLADRMGDAANAANVTYNRCDVLVRQGRWTEATSLLASVARAARAQDDIELVALVELEVGRVNLGRGDVDEARSHLVMARSQLGELGLTREAGEADLDILACGVASVVSGDSSAPVEAELATALATAASNDASHGALARLHFLRGALFMATGRPAEALADFDAGVLAPLGEGGYDRALNELGVVDAARSLGESRPESRAGAGAALARLGVRELPIPLSWTAWSGGWPDHAA